MPSSIQRRRTGKLLSRPSTTPVLPLGAPPMTSISPLTPAKACTLAVDVTLISITGRLAALERSNYAAVDPLAGLSAYAVRDAGFWTGNNMIRKLGLALALFVGLFVSVPERAASANFSTAAGLAGANNTNLVEVRYRRYRRHRHRHYRHHRHRHYGYHRRHRHYGHHRHHRRYGHHRHAHRYDHRQSEPDRAASIKFDSLTQSKKLSPSVREWDTPNKSVR